METENYIILIAIGIPFFFLFQWLLRSTNYKDEKIRKYLEKRKLKLVSIRKPGFSDLNPFGDFEIRISFIRSRVLGVSGEYTQDRIVTYKDRKGKTKISWVRIETSAFNVVKMRWEPELK